MMAAVYLAIGVVIVGCQLIPTHDSFPDNSEIWSVYFPFCSPSRFSNSHILQIHLENLHTPRSVIFLITVFHAYLESNIAVNTNKYSWLNFSYVKSLFIHVRTLSINIRAKVCVFGFFFQTWIFFRLTEEKLSFPYRVWRFFLSPCCHNRVDHFFTYWGQ